LSPEAKYKQTAGGAMARPNRLEDLKAHPSFIQRKKDNKNIFFP
jgi:hypothetical protein